ncbi:MAG: Ig-like domain-containing protein [Elusimicrobia bacterium]|nr:Ig-like domain-containing protein [Elusimicrobiota bacterium]
MIGALPLRLGLAVAFLSALSGPARSAVLFSDDFASYAGGSCAPDAGVLGPWTAAFGGFGCTQAESDAGQSWLSEQPQASVSPVETHAGLALGPAFGGAYELTVKARTVAQLRKNSPPNPWEVAWVAWDYSDDAHFYYFYVGTQGWELGKRDPAYPGGQRFLATGPEIYAPEQWHAIKIAQTAGGVFAVFVDGGLVVSFTDAERPYASGRIGLYNEDAHVHFTGVQVEADAGPDLVPPVISGVSAASVGPYSAVVAWTTDEAADGRIEYGLSAAYGQAASISAPRVTAHSAALSYLTAGTLYHYRVLSRDAAGNLSASSDQVFTTLPTADITAPVVAIASPGAGASLDYSPAFVSGTASDSESGVAGIRLRVNGGPWAPAAGQASWSSAAALSSGINLIEVQAIDAAGNESPVAAVGVSLAGGAPVPPVQAAPAKAARAFLSPALADGVNDEAVFGPGAEEVSVFDVRGRRVFRGARRGGAPIAWNCRDETGRIVRSGVYLAKIRTAGEGVVYQSLAVVK